MLIPASEEQMHMTTFPSTSTTDGIFLVWTVGHHWCN